MDNRKKLIEQYDDAVFALLMDEHAESEGAQLLTQFQAAVDTGVAPVFPEALDRKCSSAIETEFTQRRWKSAVNALLRTTVRVVLAVFMVLGAGLRWLHRTWRARRSRQEEVYDLTFDQAELCAPDPPDDIAHTIFLTV